MIPDFGAGLRRFLFEQNTEQTRDRVRQSIVSQVRKYMPFIDIRQILVSADTSEEIGLIVEISYEVPRANLANVLTLRVAT